MRFQVGRFTCEMSLDASGRVQTRWFLRGGRKTEPPKYLDAADRRQYRDRRDAFLRVAGKLPTRLEPGAARSLGTLRRYPPVRNCGPPAWLPGRCRRRGRSRRALMRPAGPAPGYSIRACRCGHRHDTVPAVDPADVRAVIKAGLLAVLLLPVPVLLALIVSLRRRIVDGRPARLLHTASRVLRGSQLITAEGAGRPLSAEIAALVQILLRERPDLQDYILTNYGGTAGVSRG